MMVAMIAATVSQLALAEALHHVEKQPPWHGMVSPTPYATVRWVLLAKDYL